MHLKRKFKQKHMYLFVTLSLESKDVFIVMFIVFKLNIKERLNEGCESMLYFSSHLPRVLRFDYLKRVLAIYV